MALVVNGCLLFVFVHVFVVCWLVLVARCVLLCLCMSFVVWCLGFDVCWLMVVVCGVCCLLLDV